MKGNFNSIINSEKPVLVDFYADWCGPCKVQTPILFEIARELSDQLSVIKIDVDKNPEIAAKYSIQGVPTLILFRNGEVKWRQSGVIEKNSLRRVISQYGN